jgi:hypothetical protein
LLKSKRHSDTLRDDSFQSAFRFPQGVKHEAALSHCSYCCDERRAPAQSTKVPEILTPDAYLRSQAETDGFTVFKLVPRGMFKDPEGSYADRDNPIGIRGGGAYYSFTTGSHSYNKVPQIGYENCRLSVGFYGFNYGTITDLGPVPLSALSSESTELAPFLRYVPARFEKEIRKEAMAYQRSVPAVTGHTYALRAISYDEADTVVVFNISNMEQNGSLTILWKKIADLPKPIALYQTDEELAEKVRGILNENGYSDVELAVKDNLIILSGTSPKGSINKMFQLLREVRNRGFQTSVRER